MALKLTTRFGGQEVVLEGTTGEVVSALKVLQQEAPKTRSLIDVATDVIQNMKRDAPEPQAPGTRNPRGYNRKLALQALASAGLAGSLQAHVQQWIAKVKGVDLAVSSVRHALNQLQENGWAMRTDDTWRISGAGVTALAKMEDDLADLLG